ncbi:MAG: hypothetical protein E3J41_07590 [Candidatus Cloacimonadota bacterium]|nr:MAG: hypothetical protein E3J41_07590 [Candidatus Cloacimonadota bacterium]
MGRQTFFEMILKLLFTFLIVLPNKPNDVNLISNRYFDIFYPSARKNIAEDVSNYSVSELERISRNLHITAVEKIQISILEENEFNEKYGSYLPEWGIGFAIPKKSLIILKFPMSFFNPSRLKFIVGHEIAHVLIHRKAGAFIPRWFDEGTAIYLSKEPNFIDEIKLSTAVILKRIIPLKDLTQSFPYSGARANLAYIESASTIEYLISEYGPYIVNQILSETKEARDFGNGFLIATGVDLTVFELEWRTWLKKRFTVTFILKPNLLFLIVAIFVIIIGITRKLRRSRLRSSDECIED